MPTLTPLTYDSTDPNAAKLADINKSVANINASLASNPTGVIPVSTLATTPVSPAKVIQPAPATQIAGVQGAVVANQDAYTQNLADQTAQAKANVSPVQDAFYKALLGQTTEGQATNTAYADTVDPAQKALNEINNQITAEQVSARHQIEALQANPEGLSTGALQSRIDDINRQSISKQADLAVIQLARQGQYDSAKAIADRAVSAQMEAQKNRLEALQFMYQDNKDLFTKAEQRQFESAQADRNRKLEMDTYKEKARYDNIIKQNDPLYRAQLAKAQQDLNAGNVTLANPKYAGVAQTILASGKFTKDQSAQIIAGINRGEDPATVIRNQAKNIMGQTEATNVTKYESAKSAMENLQSALAEYYANGGKTGILSGNYEKVINNLGSVQDPKLVDLATQIASQLQVYRNAVSGTAYSVQEGKEIGTVFPGINKSQGLNQAIISGRLKSFDSTINGVYGATLGSNTYQNVLASSGAKGSQSSRDYVEKTLTGLGKSYDSVVSGARNGEIPVINNSTGKIGYILPGEYNSTTYTRI